MRSWVKRKDVPSTSGDFKGFSRKSWATRGEMETIL